jgi:hypothetical protein
MQLRSSELSILGFSKVKANHFGKCWDKCVVVEELGVWGIEMTFSRWRCECLFFGFKVIWACRWTKDGGSRFLWFIGMYLQVHVVLQSRRSTSAGYEDIPVWRLCTSFMMTDLTNEKRADCINSNIKFLAIYWYKWNFRNIVSLNIQEYQILASSYFSYGNKTWPVKETCTLKIKCIAKWATSYTNFNYSEIKMTDPQF